MPKRMIYVVPLEGLTVRVPKTKAKLPEKGGWVPAENYWLRRIADGSVREAESPEIIEEKPKIEEAPKWVKRNKIGGN